MKNLSIITKNYLHHAYIVEGDRAVIVRDLLIHLEEEKIIDKENMPIILSYDHMHLEEAQKLRASLTEKTDHSVYIISVDSILIEAEQALLKLFEEPIIGIYFFIVIPDIGGLLPTFLSRCIVIPRSGVDEKINKQAVEFLKISHSERMDFVKKILDGYESAGDARVFTKSFLTAIVLKIKEFDNKNIIEHKEFLKNVLEHIALLNTRGSSPKMLLEYCALSAPIIIK